MKNVLNISVSLFRGAQNPVPIDTVNLYDWLRSSEYKTAIEKIRNAATSDEVKQLKKKLRAVTPSGTFAQRNAAGLIQHSGLICIDIDADPNSDVRDFDKLKEFMSCIPYVAWCSRSASGRGFFALAPIARPDKHKEHFDSLKADFARCGLTIDNTPDVCRLRFASYDPDPYINLNAKIYDRILEPQRRKPPRKNNRRPSGKTAKEVADIVETIVANGIDITEVERGWLEIGSALANMFGSDGRQYYHDVSQFHPKYDPDETDRMYNRLLKDKYNFDIGTFFHYAKLYGVTVKAADPVAEAREAFKQYLK